MKHGSSAPLQKMYALLVFQAAIFMPALPFPIHAKKPPGVIKLLEKITYYYIIKIITPWEDDASSPKHKRTSTHT